MSDDPGLRKEPRAFGQRNEEADSGGAYMGLGLQFGGAIILFMFVGMWLDRKLGSSPWLLIIGVFGGAAAGFYSIYRRLVEDQKREDARRKR